MPSRLTCFVVWAAAIVPALVHAIRGVSYDSYNVDKVHDHFATIAQRFDTVRTFQTYLYTTNAVEVAAKHNLKLYAGLWLRGGLDFATDLQAAVTGAKAHPNTIQAVLVGNEDLSNGLSVGQVLGFIQRTRSAFADAGLGSIPIGSVQIDGDWLAHPELAAACDVVGVNIYPFFGASPQSVSDPIQDLAARWSAVHDQFKDKALLTETGWSFGGGNFGQHIANPENAQAYFAKVQEWTKTSGNGGTNPMYFMFHDHKAKGGYEANFGLADENGVWKFNFDKSPNPAPAPAPAPATGSVSFQSHKASDAVLAATESGGVSFQPRGYTDKATVWTWTGQLLQNQATGKCLDAFQGWSGGAVHTWPCDEANVNQKWEYDAATNQLKHLTHKGFCLDIATPSGDTPYLWECHTQGHDWLAYQQFNVV